MATEAWVALFIAITLPLIGFAWSNMQSKVTKVDRDAVERLDKLELSLRKEINDRHVDSRHRIENVNLQLGEMLMKENRDASDKMIKSIELMIELLREPATSEIIARRQIGRKDNA